MRRAPGATAKETEDAAFEAADGKKAVVDIARPEGICFRGSALGKGRVRHGLGGVGLTSQGSPTDPGDSGHVVEMGVAADDRQFVLTGDGGDPQIVHRNGCTSGRELETDLSVVAGRGFIG